MNTEISITLNPEDENKNLVILQKIIKELKKQKISVPQAGSKDKIRFVNIKRSVDARHAKVKLYMRYKVYIGERIEDQDIGQKTVGGASCKTETGRQDFLPIPKIEHGNGAKKVVIIGSGPAGLFGALRLLENGIRPVIIERGSNVSQRKRDIAQISLNGVVDPNSNYCFGEGGAGTFSDGKLYTRSNKRGDVSRILKILVYFGADPAILTDSHPHIGTDKLPKIIDAVHSTIIDAGGEFYFNTLFTDFLFDERSNSKTVCGVCVQNTKTGESSQLDADAVLLASGHSASDIYFTLAKTDPSSLEAKTFAAGVRVEHPRKIIDKIQYHGNASNLLSAAEYSLTTQADGRGVYSFCMCPGGFVVPSSTSSSEIVINGMSQSSRNSPWSNSAVVVEIRPEDIPERFKEQAKQKGCVALAGLFYRTYLEIQTKKHGEGQKAPAQRLCDFLDKRPSQELPKSSYFPGLVPSRLDLWLDPRIKTRIEQGFKNFNKMMKGFICPEAIIIASETRTSTPVRILRSKETFESPALKNLFPAGEGSGYSGGIVSSAMDGENACAAIAKKLKSSSS
ncbi:FAD-dependent protein [Treponema parvum]|uniref:FAD-dependent protein n=1 Tax=Treponema parvum TaxID=138851 RepID=UPI001AEBD9D9|nr:FAD-binding protein [Treponema parvum]QTQ15546.1 FAD-dependent monooxygenase [Treponema parvum]